MHKVFYYTYIVASRTHALYIGMTNDIERRVTEHKEGNYLVSQHNTDAIDWYGSNDIPHRAQPSLAKSN
jgi:putative endonuclease